MATPLGPDRLVKILRDAGLVVVEHRSWRTNNRNHVGAWGPVEGVMVHHTVTSGELSSVELCYNGHSTLPGPLVQMVIGKSGKVYMVGNGRCNHAGSGDGDVLAAVKSGAALPADNEANTDGNRYFYGFECVNLGNGTDPWPEVQLEAIEKASAAICQEHGWSHKRVIGHLEWQPGKVDPRGFTMTSMRTRIAGRIAEGNDVALTEAEIDKIAHRVWSWSNEDLDPRDERQFLADAANHAKVSVQISSLLRTSLTGIEEKVADIAVGGVDYDVLAAKVADLLAARLAS